MSMGSELEGRSRVVAAYDLGTTSYGEVHKLQQRLQGQRREGQGRDTLLLTEHRPVFTLGRSHPRADLRVPEETVKEYGIEVVQTERGGNITYHGPGQLVAYPIVALQPYGGDVHEYVLADPIKLKQILINLLTNAVKITPTGGAVTLSCEETGKWVTLSITDVGPGIPGDIRDRIFYPLVSGRDDGSGLGLTLAQSFVHQHDGLIEVESRPGCTEFAILLPFEN